MTFLGVTSAGADRFDMPKLVKAWEGVKGAQTWSPTCPIPEATSVGGDDFVFPHRYWVQNEQCRVLNIWTQSTSQAAKEPVMVWMHGGGFTNGFPAWNVIYRFKQHRCYLLLKKHRTRQQCVPLAARLLDAIGHLRQTPLPHLAQLGETLHSWKEEIARMWRFTRNNGITEGFHNKMETISRQAYGFRNFENYRLRVKVLCG